MGQKVNPIGLRLGINRTWDSRWFAGKGEYGRLLHEDIKIRGFLMTQLKQAAAGPAHAWAVKRVRGVDQDVERIQDLLGGIADDLQLIHAAKRRDPRD